MICSVSALSCSGSRTFDETCNLRVACRIRDLELKSQRSLFVVVCVLKMLLSAVSAVSVFHMEPDLH